MAPAASSGDAELARLILREHHLLPNPTAAQLQFATELVRDDPEGSRALAFGLAPPSGRQEVLAAPALGVYLPALRAVAATPEAICGLVADEYNLSVDALVSPELVPEHVWPRQAGIYLASRRTAESAARIARVFGRERAMTVRRSCDAVAERVRGDVVAANALARLDAAVVDCLAPVAVRSRQSLLDAWSGPTGSEA